jgi:hypothetical protein
MGGVIKMLSLKNHAILNALQLITEALFNCDRTVLTNQLLADCSRNR